VSQAQVEKTEGQAVSKLESVAKVIYKQFPYEAPGRKPAWVNGGNSLKQDEARRYAAVAIEAIESPSPDEPNEVAKAYLETTIAELRELSTAWPGAARAVQQAIEDRAQKLTEGMDDHSDHFGDEFHLPCSCYECSTYHE
jgi:hypothetical protein